MEPTKNDTPNKKRPKVILDSDEEDDDYPQFTSNTQKTEKNGKPSTSQDPNNRPWNTSSNGGGTVKIISSTRTVTVGSRNTNFSESYKTSKTVSSTEKQFITPKQFQNSSNKGVSVFTKAERPTTKLLQKRPQQTSKASKTQSITVPRPGKLKRMKKTASRAKSRGGTSRGSKKDLKPTIAEKVYEFQVPTSKHPLVHEILKRWWYCMPDWPPKDDDYAKKLQKRNLREVLLEEWRISPEEVDGKRKVYQIPGYQGLFRDSNNDIIDLRDKTMCPSFSNLKKFDSVKLANMLVEALRNQLAALIEVDNHDTELEKQLKAYLRKVQKAYKKYLTEQNSLPKQH